MEKALAILEKNVQWLVLGLAVGFLGWVAYAYVVTPPAQIKLGNKTVLPGEIADETNNSVAKPLEKKMHDDRATFTTPDLVAAWQAHMNMGQPAEVALTPNWTVPLPQVEGKIEGGGTEHTIHIAEVPMLPPAAISNPVQAGRSVVQDVIPGAAAAPAPPANLNGPAVPQGRDLFWVNASATIPAKALADALLAPLKGQPIDPAFYATQLLQVEMERQQALGIDQMGNPVFPADDVKVEKVAAVVVDPTQVMPMPQPNSPLADKYNYLTWAAQHTDLIATPPFYPVVTGSPFVPPPPPNNAAAAPGAVAPGAAPATSPAAAPASGPAVAPTAPAPITTNGIIPGRTGSPYDRNFGTGGFAQGVAFPTPMQVNGQPGFINPYAIPTDILIYAFDQDVKPGQYYRYRLIYSMKNPVFASKNIADDKLVDQFALKSKPSDWCAAVKVPDKTQYYIASIAPHMEQAKMDLFEWKTGVWKRTPLTVAPGETLPGTDVTVVDIRSNDSRGRDKYILFATDDGKSFEKNANKDAADPDYDDLKNQLNNPPGNGVAPPVQVPNRTLPPVNTPRGGPTNAPIRPRGHD